MAQTAVQIDEMLKCSICLETFKSPKYLPCLHSFCETCLSSYITSSVKPSDDAKGFNCPVCRQFTEPTERSAPVATWIQQIPTNHFIVSLIDKVAIENSEKLCDPCSSRNESTKATVWCTDCPEALCEKCTTYHKSLKITKDHNLIELSKLEDKANILKCGVTRVTCELHKTEEVKFLCADHNFVCCVVCATINHRKCEHVISIEEAASDIRNSSETKQLIKQLVDDNTLVEELLMKRKNNITSIVNSSKEVENEIHEVRSKVNGHLDKIEAEVQKDLQTIKSETLKDLTTSELQLKETKESIVTCQRVLKACIDHASDIQCFMEVTKIRKQEDVLKKELETEKNKISRMKMEFAQRPNLSSLTEYTNVFGSIRLNDIDFRKSSIKVVQKIKIPNDKQLDTITLVNGIFISDKIVIVEWQQSRLFVFTSDGKLEQKLDLPGKPFDVTRIDEKTILVSLTNKSEHVIIHLHLDTIATGTVDTKESARGMVYKNDTLSFCTEDGKSLKVMDMVTKTITSIPVEFNQVWFIHLTPEGNYICTDNGKGNVTFRNATGAVTSTYTTEVNEPRGIDVDVQGNVYIVNMDSNTILQLTKDAKLIRTIYSEKDIGIKNPWTIRFQEGTNKFMVTPTKTSSEYFVAICEFV